MTFLSWNNFKNSVSFLTIIRLKSDDFDAPGAAHCFTLAGMLVGALSAFVFYLLKDNVPPVYTAFAVTLFLALITGGLHLDGLADTCDGLFSGRSLSRKLEIMKDSRTGAMGVIAIVLAVSGKIAALSQINSVLAVFLAPSLGRFAVLFPMYFLPYAREEGTAGAFRKDFTLELFYQGIPLLIIGLFVGIKVWIITIFIFSISAALVVRYYKRVIGGYTGDMLGCICELSETLMFFVLGALL